MVEYSDAAGAGLEMLTEPVPNLEACALSEKNAIAKVQAADENLAKQPLSWLQRLLLLDRQTSTQLFSIGRYLRFLLILFEHSGNGLFWLPVTIALWLSPWPFPPATRDFFLNLFSAFVLDLIVIGGLKSLFRRQRPVYNRGQTVILAPDHWSFPSGHASRAVLIACCIGMCQPHLVSKYVSQEVAEKFALWACVWAVLTAASRVFLGRHYLLDVVAGSLLGYLEASTIVFMLWIPLKVSESLYESYLGCLFMRETCRVPTQHDILVLFGVEAFKLSA